MASIEDALVAVVFRAYEEGFSTSSNFARLRASEVAMAASIGLISTRLSGEIYGKTWRPTILGLRFLNERELED